MNNETYIRKTFELARRGLGTTWPNPMVGAVIVKDGRIIGEGFHRRKGEDHAEVDAIKNATESVEGSTIYVNLEPCCHTNKTTPPCAQRLIKEKFKKVVIANLDPNIEVNGKGVELLRSHGIEVEHGILPSEAEKLNEVFFHAQRLRRPFIHLKAAVTLDGKMALSNGESQWITGEKAREHVHYLRSLHQGIIVGGETVRRDNPKLTVRLPGYEGPQPKRIIFTTTGDLPETHHVFTDEFKDNTLVYKTNDLHSALQDLFSRNLINLMLECGPGLATAFLREGLIDRMTIFQNPSFIGEGQSLLGNLNLTKLASRPRLTDIESLWLGEDHLITGRLLCSQD